MLPSLSRSGLEELGQCHGVEGHRQDQTCARRVRRDSGCGRRCESGRSWSPRTAGWVQVRPVASLRVQREAWAGIGRLLLCVMCAEMKRPPLGGLFGSGGSISILTGSGEKCTPSNFIGDKTVDTHDGPLNDADRFGGAYVSGRRKRLTYAELTGKDIDSLHHPLQDGARGTVLAVVAAASFAAFRLSPRAVSLVAATLGASRTARASLAKSSRQPPTLRCILVSHPCDQTYALDPFDSVAIGDGLDDE